MNFNEFDKILGDKIFESRVVKRITQGELTDMINNKLKEQNKKPIARQSFSAYERGTRDIPSNVFRICCQLLDMDHDAILDEAFNKCKDQL